MIIAKELLLDVDDTALFVIQSDYGGVMKPYLTQLLGLLRVPLERIRSYEVQSIDKDGTGSHAARLAVDELIVIDWRWENDEESTIRENYGNNPVERTLFNTGLLPDVPGNISESVPPILRQQLLPQTQLRHCPPRYALERTRSWATNLTSGGDNLRTTKDRRRTLVFVSRRQAQTRKLSENVEHRLLQRFQELLLSQEGWNVMVYSDSALPSMEETIRIFGLASVVVGVHGAGLSHLVFCQAGTQVVEIALPEPHALYFEHLSNELGLGYTKVLMYGLGLYGAPTLPASAFDEDAVVSAVSNAIDNVVADISSLRSTTHR
jgi:hypothetical protein